MLADAVHRTAPRLRARDPEHAINVTEPISRQAALTPDRIAFVGATGVAATYTELERTVNGVATRLRELGIAPGQSAALAIRDLYPYIVVALALGRLGAAFAPVSLPVRLTDIALQDADSQGNGCEKTIMLSAVWPGDPAVQRDAATVAAHDGGAVTLMHCPSSGTTGTPKFVSVSHDLALRRVQARAQGLAGIAGGRGIGAARLACYISPSTSYGFSTLLVVLSGGGTVLEPNLSGPGMPSWLAGSGVNHIVASPIGLQKLVDVLPAQRGPSALTSIEVGGGLLSAHLYDLVRQRMCERVSINYGMTECGSVAGAPIAEVMGKPGAVGYAHHGVAVEIVDADDRPVSAGREGIIRVRSARAASGYLDDAPASAAVFRAGWVYPGDRGVLETDGLLRMFGRTNDVINRGGVKVDPRAIEDALMALAELREVAVFGVPGPGITSVCAAIVPTEAIDGDTFHARCRERLGGMAPDFIMHMRELPRNPNGKVQNGELVRIAIEAYRARAARR